MGTYIVKMVEYKIGDKKDSGTWKAYIAGSTSDEIVSYLKKTVKGNINVLQINEVCRLDAVTDELRNIIVKPLLANKSTSDSTNKSFKRSPGRPKGS